MTVLSIQSRVSFGHVGNCAATLPLERLGQEVCPIDTVRFSSNPRYPGWRGTVVDETEMRGIVEGLDALPEEAGGGLGFVRAVLTGYFGSAGQVTVAADAVDRVRRRVPGARRRAHNLIPLARLDEIESKVIVASRRNK